MTLEDFIILYRCFYDSENDKIYADFVDKAYFDEENSVAEMDIKCFISFCKRHHIFGEEV